MIVLKVGGNELEEESFLQTLAASINAFPEYPVIVHGGGRGTTRLMERFGLKARFVNGLRVTDEESLSLAVMGMVGQASMQLVHALVRTGMPALGLSGADAGLIRAEKVVLAEGDLGAVGEPVAVDVTRLQALLMAGFLPCLAPISLASNGALLNVNADSMAQAVAAALKAEQLIFLTNVPAVMIENKVAVRLTPEQVEEEIARGTISGGMIPKTRSAVRALEMGVQQVLITNLTGLQAMARGDSAGTTITPAAA